MRLLVLGLSNLFQRRALPALQDIEGLERIDVASRRGAVGWQRPDWLVGDMYDQYDDALRRTQADVVYISLVNSEHGPWARVALERGLHVVVDKPAFLGLDETERALDLAAKHDVCLAEATVWSYHPQIAVMKGLFEAGSEPLRVSLAFSVPPLDPGNFRYCRSLGGGSLWDQGPYAVSVGRVFFGTAPEMIHSHVLSTGGEESVDTAFSMLAIYAGGRSVAGHFGFDTAYRNHIDILSKEMTVEADRILTIPPDAENEIRVSWPAGTEIKQAPASNPFRPFFERVFEVVRTRDWQDFSNDLLSDARGLQRLRDAAGVV